MSFSRAGPENFRNCSKTFFKTLINYIILAYFSMKFNKQCVDFWRVWTKNTKFWEILRKFSKNFFRNLWKCFILAYFSKDLTNPCVRFSPFGQKTQIVGEIWENFDENSIEKLNFIRISGKFVTKNRAFGNNIIFLQQFFRLRGGGISPPP